MKALESSWKQGKYEVFARSWEIVNPKAIVCLVHGMGEHSARYEHVANKMNAAGYAVFAYDQIGHGRTTGKKGHVPNMNMLLDTVKLVIDHASSKHPSVPIFLYGHSMGGNVAVNYILKKKPNIKGAIITSPWFTLALKPPKFQMMLANLMKNIYPAFADHTKLDANAISRDELEVKKYEDDPLVHDYMSPGYFFSIHDGGQWVLEHASELSVPMLLMHGTSDKLTSIDSTRLFAEKAGKIATFKQWEDGFHELHNDLEKEKAIQTMIEFMDKLL